jgi:uncharacterized protein YndB with AHSA1/START domain
MTERSVSHGSFTVERSYPAPPARVFAAWADPEIKRRWFGAAGKGEDDVFDFRVGGREYNAGKMDDGKAYSFDVRYYDIVPDNRIVYAYDMTMDRQRISVSVATVEFRPEGGGTQMVVTEHGAFLDGLDSVEQRQKGTEWLMDQLGEELARQAAE